jgi:hypothetical protein
MSKPTKRPGKSFWSRAEDAGDVMEIGMRVIYGVVIACIFASFAWTLGSSLWVGVGVVAAVAALPIGFLVGFFWPEFKFALWLFLKMVTGQ